MFVENLLGIGGWKDERRDSTLRRLGVGAHEFMVGKEYIVLGRLGIRG